MAWRLRGDELPVDAGPLPPDPSTLSGLSRPGPRMTETGADVHEASSQAPASRFLSGCLRWRKPGFRRRPHPVRCCHTLSARVGRIGVPGQADGSFSSRRSCSSSDTGLAPGVSPFTRTWSGGHGLSAFQPLRRLGQCVPVHPVGRPSRGDEPRISLHSRSQASRHSRVRDVYAGSRPVVRFPTAWYTSPPIPQ